MLLLRAATEARGRVEALQSTLPRSLDQRVDSVLYSRTPGGPFLFGLNKMEVITNVIESGKPGPSSTTLELPGSNAVVPSSASFLADSAIVPSFSSRPSLDLSSIKLVTARDPPASMSSLARQPVRSAPSFISPASLRPHGDVNDSQRVSDTVSEVSEAAESRKRPHQRWKYSSEEEAQQAHKQQIYADYEKKRVERLLTKGTAVEGNIPPRRPYVRRIELPEGLTDPRKAPAEAKLKARKRGRPIWSRTYLAKKAQRATQTGKKAAVTAEGNPQATTSFDAQ